MANNSWIGSSSTAFGTAGNWLTGAVPVDGDGIDFGGAAQANCAGSNQSGIQPAFLRTYRACTKSIGTNSSGTITALQIGPVLCDIGLASEGGNNSTGPATIALDFGTDPVTCTVHYARRTGENGFSCVLLAGTNASNSFLVKGGSVGFGTMTPNQATTMATLDITGDDALVTVGAGVTWTTITKSAGDLTLSSGGTSLDQNGGTLRTLGSGAITTISIDGGTATLGSSGGATNLTLSGTADVLIDRSGASYANVTLSGPGCKLRAVSGVLFPTGIQLTDGATTAQVDLGSDVTLTTTANTAASVVAKTGNYTVTIGDSGKTFTTVGASGTVTFSMPAATVGLEYKFRVGAAFELRIDPNGTETIALPSTGVQGAAGKYLVADADGETVYVRCTKAGQWSVFGYTGTWSAEP